jgi:hypothetical protein
VPTPATTVERPFEPALPLEDRDAPEDPEDPLLLDRALALDPFWLRALLVEVFFALARDLFARDCEEPALLRVLFAVAPAFDALAPFLAFEPEDDAREDLAAVDFRWPCGVALLLEERVLA